MKKILGILLLSFLLLSCSTNPVTRENYNPQKRPPSRTMGWIASVVPGLSQILNGEYLEAGLYIAGTAATYITAEALYPGIDYESNPVKMTLVTTGAAIWTWNYIDGVYSNNTRRADWETIAFGSESRAMKFVDVSKLKEGMSQTEVLLLFPRPDDVNVTHVGSVKHEQWVYTDTYLYFEDGVLVGWQY